jgi:putative transposase
MYTGRRRKNSLRLGGYDYSQIGAYFVTMCTKDRDPLFGRTENELMQLSEFGEIASQCWKEIPERFPSVKLDEFTVMPDHLHGIIVIVDQASSMNESVPGGAIRESPRTDRNNPVWRRRMLLPKIIGRFKQNSAKQINILHSTQGIPVWQRGYHDHIIHDAKSLCRIKQYIIANPCRWKSF